MSYGSPPPPPGGQPPYGQQPSPYQHPVGGAPAAGDPGTLDLPYYGIGFIPAVKRGFQKYARFDGRASRSEYWWFVLGVSLVMVALYVPLAIGAVAESGVIVGLALVLLLVFGLGMIVPSIAVAVRRLHDGGFSGWMYLLGLIPFVGGIIQLVMMCLPSKPEGARYDRGGQQAPGYGTNPAYGQNPYGQ